MSQTSTPQALVKRVAPMGHAQTMMAIDATHPVNTEAKEALEADEMAMRMVGIRHSKRDLVNLVRWLLLGAPGAEDPVNQITAP